MITQENISYTADEIKAMVKTCEKYNKALERAQKMQENSNGMILKKWLWGVFPEIKESEDERIRKEIIRILKGETGYTSKEDTDKYVAWLEKQGEKKSTDEVEPKFKVGDFITNDYCLGKVIEITNDAYLLDTGQGIPFSCEHNAHLWTIEDAEDGDVLDCEGCEYLLFKSFSNTDGRIKLYCWYNVHKNNFHDKGTDSKLRQEANIHPATKEQRDWFFSKMKEAGYEWDADKKELKKIGPKKLDAKKVINWINPDKVIEWLTANVRVYASLKFPYGSGYPQGDVEVESLIKAFKKDFGL